MIEYYKRKANIFLGIGLAVAAIPAQAWDKHRTLMPYVVAALDMPTRQALLAQGPPTCADEDQGRYAVLAPKLGLQTAISIPPSLALSPAQQKTCHLMSQSFSAIQSLTDGDWADDPDRGMDQDLDPTLDPLGERVYMGGNQGTTSQGFRHMFFGGWQWRRPIATFQIPTHAIGQAPERTQLLADEARVLARSGKVSDAIWAARLLAWSMHFVQDLAQPFHSVQVPNLRMVPWGALFQWPLSKGFAALVAETTRTISNYHFAYEHWTLRQLQLPKDESKLGRCLLDLRKYSMIDFMPATGTPRELAQEVARRSIELGAELGSAQVGFFGPELKRPGIDLPRGKGEPDYAALDADPLRADARERLLAVTCRALANAVDASRLLASWVYLR